MMRSLSRWMTLLTLTLSASFALSDSSARALGQETSVRSQAVVNLTFDEPNGDALDTAAAGTIKDNGVLQNGVRRVKSPFWGQSGKQAVVLDAAAKQFVQIADSAETDRPDAVSFSMFFVNLHPAAAAAFHGLIGKRDDQGSKVANYGINYGMSTDNFQVYVNDGTGFKVVNFSVNAAVGYRRPVFITAVFQVGDAPPPDADTDKDDVLIRFYANGQPVTPKMAAGGAIVGNDAWLLDVKVASLLNDVPLTLGSSMPTLEFTSCVIDEFSLFPKALTPEEVAKLFTEVAGANVNAQIAEESKPLPAPPEITATSLYGLQAGQKTVLAINGANLLPEPVVLLPVPIEKQLLRSTATAGRIEIELTLPAGTPTGHYPLRVQTPHGISGPLPIAVDPLPQLAVGTAGTPDKPLALPAALSGTLSGQQQTRVYFSGQAGQRIVVDLECKRLGAAMNPVLELKSSNGAPLTIQWGQPQYRGDVRIETQLTSSGLYSVELHDLAYNAPGQNAYRLKIGDLKLADAAFPPVAAIGTQRNVQLIGTGLDAAAAGPIDLQNLLPGLEKAVALPPGLGVAAPAPGVFASDATEVVEEPQPAGQLQAVAAQFAEQAHVPLGINGRISQPGETDTFLLQVKPGTKLSFVVESRAYDSPLDGQVSILKHPEGNLLAISEDKSNLEFTVPADMTTIQVAVRDLTGRGGPSYLYRVQVNPSGQPDYSLSLGAERVPLARDGSSVVRLDVARRGFGGPIRLVVLGAPDISLTPAEIPAGDSKAFVTLSMKSAEVASTAARPLRIVGESVGLNPPLRRVALVPADGRLAMVSGYRGDLTLLLTGPAGATLQLAQEPGRAAPVALFKGFDTQIPIVVNVQNTALATQTVRLTLMTTEAPRTQPVPNMPQQQQPLPLIRSLPEQTVNLAEKTGALRIAVPLNIAEPNIDCVIRADIVSHAFSDKVIATIYSPPFRLPVKSAVALELKEKALNLKGKTETKFTGTIKRTEGFAEPVEVSLLNLPAGYVAPKVTVPAGQEQFEIVISAPAVTAAADLPNIQLRIAVANGAPLQADTPLPTKVMAGQ